MKNKVMDASPPLTIIYFQNLSNIADWNFTVGKTSGQGRNLLSIGTTTFEQTDKVVGIGYVV